MAIELKYVGVSDGRAFPCSERENVMNIGNGANSWVDSLLQEKCRNFKGTETEAKELRETCENSANHNYNFWRMYQ